MERFVNGARANEGPHVLDLSNEDAKRVNLQFRRNRDRRECCYYTTQPVDSSRAFVKIFCRDPQQREAFAKEITDFLAQGRSLGPQENCDDGAASKEDSESSPETISSEIDPFEVPVVLHDIDEAEKDLKELVLLRPYAAEFLKKSRVQRGTALQRAAWPDLFAKKSMLLLAPQHYGKTVAYLPVALTMSVKMNAVILTSSESRLIKLGSALCHQQLLIEIARPPSKILNLKGQLIICNLHWFWHNRRHFTPSMIVFDRLDHMLASALDVTCVELANAFSHIPLVATARVSSALLEETVKLMNITSAVMVPTQPRLRHFNEFLISLDDSAESVRYSLLLETLRNQSLDEVILVFFDDETEVHSMYEKLEEEANRNSVPFSSFNNLREKLEDERNLLRSFLHEGVAGVYIACLQDHQWLYTTTCVDTIINYRSPECAQAYRYRRERLRNEGKILTLIRGPDLNLLPADLLHLLADLPGYAKVTPSIVKLRESMKMECSLRDTLRLHLLD